MNRFAIKFVATIAVAAVLLFAAPVSSYALTIGHRASASVPFAFTVGGANMPAGNYIFEARPANGMLILTDPTGRNHAYLTFPAGDPNGSLPARLVFEKRGTNYRLAQVYAAASGSGAALPIDKKHERMAELRRQPVEYVTLALNRN